MKDIKIKPAEKTPRVLTQAAKSPKELARNSAIQMKSQAQGIAEHSPPINETPEQYASNRIEDSTEQTAHRTGQELSDRGKQLINKQREKLKFNRESRRGTDYRSSSSFESNSFRTGKNRAQHTAKQARQTGQNTKQTVKTVDKTIKTAEYTVKTTQVKEFTALPIKNHIDLRA